MHKAQGLVVTCIDFRFQEFIDSFIRTKLGVRNHDRVAWAGGIRDFTSVLNQVKISKKLHDIKLIVLVNHQDCGAYGDLGTKERHSQDLREAAEKIKSEIPDVHVETHYLHLDGTFERIE